MSKTFTRVALAVLISLAVIVGIYTSVSGASATASEDRAGNHLVSGSKVNLDHYRSASPAPVQSEFQQPDKGQGGGCEHSNQTSPDD